MGVNELWNVLEPIAQKRSLQELSVYEGFESKHHGTGVIVLGVDASTWVYEGQFLFSSHAYSESGPTAKLCDIFYRLAWLSRSAVNAVFVFDGPQRPQGPNHKRDRLVHAVPSSMKRIFEDLVLGFGFYCYTALGKAEAELAYLNKIQAIDAVLTSDSDIFLFGATQVIRSPQNLRHLDDVDVFTANSFACQSNGAFSAQGVSAMTVFSLAIAVFNGSDDNTVGLPGCGQVTARALASGPLAKSLFNAGNHLSGERLGVFLDRWRLLLLDELANDPYGRLGRKYPSLAAGLPNPFPNPDIFRLYCHPLTTQGNGNLTMDTSRWIIPKLPDSSKLAGLCNRLFNWGPDIISKFISTVWDGYFIRLLVKVSTSTAAGTSLPEIRYITKAEVKLESPCGSRFRSYRTTFWISTLVSEIISALSECGKPVTQIQGAGSTITMSGWVPEPIIRAAASSQVAEFFAENAVHDILAEPNVYTPVLKGEF